MIELKNICFRRDEKQILDHINLTLNTVHFIAITGPNGSGKSTLAKIIMGIEKPDSGQIFMDGKDITDCSLDERARMGIAFAFQQPVKFKGITVYDMLKLAAGRDLSKTEVEEVLEKVGLKAESYIHRELNQSLSGGELKRIEIATVIVRNSKFTIFDEPEAGIDLWSFNHLIQVFTNLHKELTGTTLIITHQERILDIADELILLKDGKVAYAGPQNEMIEKLYQDCKVPLLEGRDEHDGNGSNTVG